MAWPKSYSDQGDATPRQGDPLADKVTEGEDDPPEDE